MEGMLVPVAFSSQTQHYWLAGYSYSSQHWQSTLATASAPPFVRFAVAFGCGFSLF
jgi:hypothetical protein